MDSWVGETLLGRFRVVRQLGAGGMANVYLADDELRPGWQVAIKHPLREAERQRGGLADDELRARFHREASRLIAMGEHDGVVRIEAQGAHDGTPFYVMPFLEGGSLETRLRGGPQAPADVLRWSGEIAAALDWIHARQPPVIHRDVKPSNLLFDRHGRAKLADFGILKDLDAAADATGSNTAVGTAGYMAPEQRLGDAVVDPRTDQYALAATMYRALTGVPPRYEVTDGALRRATATGRTSSEGVRKRLKPVHELAPHCSPAASAAIERGLAREQRDRFGSCTELVAAFRDALMSGPLTTGGSTRRADAALPHAAPSDGPPREARAAKPGRRALAILVILVVLVGGGLALHRPGSAPDPTTQDGAVAATGVAPSASPPPAPEPPAAGSASPDPGQGPPPADPTVPVLTVLEPLESDSVTTAALFVVRGVVADAGGLDGVRIQDGATDVPLDAAGAFRHAVPLAVDEHQEIRLIARDSAGNASSAAVRRVKREATWAAAFRDVEAALARGDGESVRDALRGPEAQEIPHARVKDALEFLRAWDAEPHVTLVSAVPVEESLAKDGLRSVRISGRLTSGRRTDRVLIDGRDATGAAAGFEATVSRPPGDQQIPYEIRSGSTVRKSGTLAVSFERPPPVMPAVPGWAEGLVSEQQKREATRLGVAVAYEDLSTGMRFVLVPGGEFGMGSRDGEGSGEEHPRHRVRLTAFYLSIHEVTNAQYRRFRPQHSAGSRGGESLDLDPQPVATVTFAEAAGYARWLSSRADPRSRAEYRLPSEAEWEYACRAGSESAYSFGTSAQIHRRANFADRRAKVDWADGTRDDGYGVTAPVGRFPSNPWGLFDMHGNVREWCADDWHLSYEGAPVDGSAWGGSGESLGVTRGGSWSDSDLWLRSAQRNSEARQERSASVGFRLARSVS